MTVMMRQPQRLAVSIALTLSSLGFVLSAPALANEEAKRPLELTDIMQFREIEQRRLSENGSWMAYTAVPDRGDSTGYVVHVTEATEYSVPRGDRPVISKDGRFAIFRQQAALLDRERAENREQRQQLTMNAVVLDTSIGEQRVIENVHSYQLSGDGLFGAFLLRKTNSDDNGRSLKIVNLEEGSSTDFEEVLRLSSASRGPRFAFVQETSADDKAAKITVLNTSNGSYLTVADAEQVDFQGLSFNHEGNKLAFFQGPTESDNPEPAQQLLLWQYGQQQASEINVEREQWVLSERYGPRWSEDDQRIFIGHRPAQEGTTEAPGKPESEADLYDLERLLADRRLQVWHGEDGRINSHQKEDYSANQARTAPGVFWVEEQRFVALSHDIEDSPRMTEHENALLLSNSREHLRDITWDGFYHDLYHVDLQSGQQQEVFSRLRTSERGHLSPDGHLVAYLDNDSYYVFDSRTGDAEPVATEVNISWVDEENDRPMEPRSYGVAGWLQDSSAFLAYDRYDIWKISLDGEAVNLTQTGRDDEKRFRVERTDDEPGLDPAQPLLVHAYHDRLKYHGFYQLDLNSGDFSVLVEGNKRYNYLGYMQEEERYLFTEEDFRQFPDIWSANQDFSELTRLTDINPQQSEFVWGDPELIDWQTEDGETLQGIVIKPDGYDPERRYPVMVYYYEQFSQRLYHFNQMKVNHRPNFPFYLGQDYVVFLPDIRFRKGAPGPSATESLVPAMEKIVEMGIADPDAIGLHGHSWSGYQSAFVVTETDIFAAVVSGAPVSNMTSAYSGIRWGSGLARQFQYETGQSRIGPNMYEDLDPYIKNSPVFFADRINTPMLIQFGDDDGAVPWEQGIEYYLALRRLNKEVVMLHYENEPHHLQQYANKIDYTIKMLEFFDHYLKGDPAPDWWLEGMPYQQYDN